MNQLKHTPRQDAFAFRRIGSANVRRQWRWLENHGIPGKVRQPRHAKMDGKVKATTAAGPSPATAPSRCGRQRRDSGETFIRVAKAKSNFAITAATSRRASREACQLPRQSAGRVNAPGLQPLSHRQRPFWPRGSCRQPRNASFEISTALRTSPAEISAISTDGSPGLRTLDFGSAHGIFRTFRVARCVGTPFRRAILPVREPGARRGRGRLEWALANSCLRPPRPASRLGTC